jgi:hypothetical protein
MISGALTLLTNALITYNTWKLHQMLERRKACGRRVPADEMLAHIARSPSDTSTSTAPTAFRSNATSTACSLPIQGAIDERDNKVR